MKGDSDCATLWIKQSSSEILPFSGTLYYKLVWLLALNFKNNQKILVICENCVILKFPYEVDNFTEKYTVIISVMRYEELSAV